MADYTPTLGDYTELKPFRFWCQKVLPLVYDDTLSYYELLCKVVDYLNKTMEDVDTMHDDVVNLHSAYVQLQTYVNTYFDNLDVQEEINNKLDAMAEDGSLSTILNSIVTSNLPPLVVDSTGAMTNRAKMYVLSSNGHLYQWSNDLNAFADTGLSYGTIANVLTTKIAISEGDLNELAPNTLTVLSYPATGDGIANNPANNPAYVLTYQFGENVNAKLQLLYEYNSKRRWFRQCDASGTWGAWSEVIDEWFFNGGVVGSAISTSAYKDLRDMNEAPVNTFLVLSGPPSSGSYTNTPNSIQSPAWLMTWGFPGQTTIRMQEYWDYETSKHYHRTCKANGTWSAWINDDWFINGGWIGTSTPVGDSPYYAVRDLNQAPKNALIALNAPLPSGETYLNTPNGWQTLEYVVTFSWGYNSTACLQFYFNYDTGAGFSRRCTATGTWSNWVLLTGGSIYNTTNNITENTYENTYNITATPSITTDNHNWLAATGTNADRTSDIMTMLTQTGYCHLGEGTFYIGGQIEMPANSTIVGCGNKTVLKSLSTYQGAMLIPTQYCTVSGLRIEANGSAGNDIGAEVGVLIFDTKTSFSGEGAVSTHNFKNNIIKNVFFNHFNGSGINMRGTGGDANYGSIIDGCIFENCSVGLNISFFSEYHKITGCIIGSSNYIGVVNNGGNNNFVNCRISGSSAAFVIDNSASNLVNEAHGLCVGCEFNHTGSNTGDAIRILGTNNSFLFSGCNLWYGVITLNNSKGITFNGICGGGSTIAIAISNCAGIMFSNMQLNQTPTITKTSSSNVRFVNCYNYLTGAEISA